MSTRAYAEGTTVNAGRTKGEIEDMLMARGVTQFGTFTDAATATIAFRFGDLNYRISIALPDPADGKFTRDTRGYVRTENAAHELYTKELNRRWRALGMVIKAKLVAIDEGIMTFEEEFLSYAITGDGRTVGQHAIPALLAGAKAGNLPSTLSLPGGS